MNSQLYAMNGETLAIGEQYDGYGNAETMDLSNSDYNCDVNKLQPNGKRYDSIRMCEILEHLTNDYDALQAVRIMLKDDGLLLVTVPYNGIAPYHVRLHNKWSITQLLAAAGFAVETYMPRKAPRLDRFIAGLRFVFGQCVNGLFFKLNAYLPIKPNGGYFYCRKAEPLDIYAINKTEFANG